jgi:membrane-associated phospholipid phosphatase
MRRAALILLSICFCAGFARTQDDSTGIAAVRFDKAYIKSYWTDTKNFLSAPDSWKPAQAIAGTAVLAGTVILITQDAAIQQFFYKNQSSFTENTSKYFFDPLGNGLYSIPALGILYGCGAIWHNGQARGTALKGVEAYLITAVFTQVIKQALHRHRPNQDEPPDPYAWDGPFADIHYNAFPSFHSSAIFAIATVVSLSYQKTVWVPVVCYTLASLTAISRMSVNEHWASDVLMGAALGFGIGSLVYNGTKTSVKVLPVSSTGPGCTVILPIR